MQQRGFTLIELIIVIVILGILAVTAAPRFIDLQSDATSSTLEGVKSALQGGSQLVYAKSAIAGSQASPTGSITLNGNTVATVFGYPDANNTANIAEWVELTDFTVTAGAGAGDPPDDATAAVPGGNTFGISPSGSTPDFTVTAADGASCHVLYTNATSSTTSPTISVVTGGC